ncbi:MAG: c-type cytochrome biogenesis protein CcmI [Pseudomonadota bacterium]
MSVGFWILAALLTAAAVVLAAWPLWAGRRAAPPNAAHDVSVYKAQLAEVDRDLARGVITAAEAEGAKREIARRLLAADEALAGAQSFPTATPEAARLGLIAIAGPLVAVGVAVYLVIGAPLQPDRPFADRDLAAERIEMLMTQADAEAEARASGLPEPAPLDEETAELIERMKATLAERPGEPRGRILLAEAYTRLGRPAEAWPRYAEAIRLLGNEAEPRLFAAMGDAMVQAAGGYVSREAEAAFTRGGAFLISQYMLGAADAQRRDYRRAFARWTSLYQDALSEPFAPMLKAQIERIAPAVGEQAVAAAARLPDPRPPEMLAEAEGAPGPNQEQIAAAAEMSEEARAEMIDGMVAGLAARLENDPSDLGGWIRLIRAYGVLGREDARAAALASARDAFAEDEAALAQLDAAARAAAQP